MRKQKYSIIGVTHTKRHRAIFIDFKRTGETLRIESYDLNEKLNQVRGMALEYFSNYHFTAKPYDSKTLYDKRK